MTNQNLTKKILYMAFILFLIFSITNCEPELDAVIEVKNNDTNPIEVYIKYGDTTTSTRTIINGESYLFDLTHNTGNDAVEVTIYVTDTALKKYKSKGKIADSGWTTLAEFPDDFYETN